MAHSGAIVLGRGAMDPLSEVLSVLKLRSSMAAGFDAAGRWAVQFPRHDGVKCYALFSGRCCLKVEGVEGVVEAKAGDCFLLPRGVPFRLGSDAEVPAMEVEAMMAVPLVDGVRTVNGGGECFGVGGHFAFAGGSARLLTDALPPIVHLRSEAEKLELRWSLERMWEELREPRPGGSLVLQQLATTMLVQALRLHQQEGLSGRSGWLSALMQGPIEGAMRAIHAEPAAEWTLGKLAARSGMSRSIFAAKFKAVVGTSPMEYLQRWRMLLAGDRLRSGEEAVAAIAGSLGYRSESAFSKAFRRAMGCSPRQYRRERSRVEAGALVEL